MIYIGIDVSSKSFVIHAIDGRKRVIFKGEIHVPPEKQKAGAIDEIAFRPPVFSGQRWIDFLRDYYEMLNSASVNMPGFVETDFLAFIDLNYPPVLNHQGYGAEPYGCQRLLHHSLQLPVPGSGYRLRHQIPSNNAVER